MSSKDFYSDIDIEPKPQSTWMTTLVVVVIVILLLSNSSSVLAIVRSQIYDVFYNVACIYKPSTT